MADQDTIWTAVKVAYPEAYLLPLVTGMDPSPTSIGVTEDAVGTAAAKQTIDLWPAYVQEAFDVSDALHMAVALRGTIAVLFERGGTSATIAKVEWKEVFDNNGLMGKVKRTGPRGRPAPTTNSGVSQKSELLANGQRARPWADWASLPHGIRPQRRSSVDD